MGLQALGRPRGKSAERALTPERFGKYTLVRRLATGGMGEVFLARMEGPAGFSKELVVKRILRHLAVEKEFVDLFLNEARLAALLSHGNLVQLFELGEVEGSYFLAMEYVRGASLSALLSQRGALPWPQAVAISVQLLRGLHYAHELRDPRGQPLELVHRDVSPDNVLLGVDGAVKLTDFGIARAASAKTTRSGVVRGKYAYMSPEQLKGGRVDRRSDLYAVGVVLFQALTARHPFEATTEPAMIEAALQAPPPPVRAPGAPVGLEAVVLRALAKNADGRFASAAEMADALDALLRTEEARAALPLPAFLRASLPAEAGAAPANGTEVLRASEGKDEPPAAPPTRSRGWLRAGLVALALGALWWMLSRPRLFPPVRLSDGSAAGPSSLGSTAGGEGPRAASSRPTGAPAASVGSGAGAVDGSGERGVTNAAGEASPRSGTDGSGERATNAAREEPPRSGTDGSGERATNAAREAPPRSGIDESGERATNAAREAPPRSGTDESSERATNAAREAPPRSGIDGSGERGAPNAAREAPPRSGTDESSERATNAAREEPPRSMSAATGSGARSGGGADSTGAGEVTGARASTRDRRPPEGGTGRVLVRAFPWAEILIDGESVGTTPLPALTLPVGRHVLTFRNPELGLERRVTVQVRGGRLVQVKQDLLAK